MGSHEGPCCATGAADRASGGIISAPKGRKHGQGTRKQPRPPSSSLRESLLGTRRRQDRSPHTDGGKTPPCYAEAPGRPAGVRAYTLPGSLCGVGFRPQGGCETRPRKAACQAAWLSRASKTARGPGPRLDLSDDTQPHGPARHKQHPAPAWARVPTSARASETLSLNPRDQGPSLIHISTKEPLSSGNCTGRCLGFKSFCLAKVTAHPRKKTSHLLAEHCSQASGPLPFSVDTPHMHCPTPRTYCGPECLPRLSPFSGKALTVPYLTGPCWAHCHPSLGLRTAARGDSH